MPLVTQNRLRSLGRTYARQATILVRVKAAEQGVKLPVKYAEFFTLLQSIYEVMEREHSVVWDSLPASYQDAFLHAFWSVMVKSKVALPFARTTQESYARGSK